MSGKQIQVNFRMPASLKARLEDSAAKEGRSLTAEIVHRLTANVADLRDEFAAKAMHAELMTCGVPGQACDAMVAAAAQAGREPEEQIAWNSYRMADAMLAAREVKP